MTKDGTVHGARSRGIYVASRATILHAEVWQRFRAQGFLLTSSWIDEVAQGATQDFADLWMRIWREIQTCEKLVLFANPEDFPLKGALIEAGIAIGLGKPVIVSLPGVQLEPRSCRPIGSWINHPSVHRIDDLLAAMRWETPQ